MKTRDKKRFIRMGMCLLILWFLYFKFSKQEDLQESNVQYETETVVMKETFDIVPKEFQLISEVQNCYINTFEPWINLPSVHWFDIPQTVERCATKIRANIPFIEAGPENYERKYYMIPRLQYINDPCSVITFGIGNEIVSEQHIKMTLPHCTFLGFDPNSDYENLFVKNLTGKFIQTGVAGKAGKMKILQLRKSGVYAETPGMRVRAAADLIKTYHGNDEIVDILNIDIEGSEYGVFEEIMKDKIFQNVCQLNVEIHPVWYLNTGYSYSDVIKIFKNLAEEGTFVWVKTFVHYAQFYPSFFINVKNEKCKEKYLKDRLFY